MAKDEKQDSSDRQQADLNLDRILAAAIDLANMEGHEAVTFRRLAGDLGVAPMSIYGYVDSKDDLFDRMAERMMDLYEVPIASSLTWEEALAEVYKTLYDLLISNPSLARLLATRRIISLGVTRKISAALTVLRDAGLSSEQSVSADAVLTSYTLGWVEYEARRSDEQGHPGENTMVEKRLIELATARNFPIVQEVAHELSIAGQNAPFEFGLQLLISGLSALASVAGGRDHAGRVSAKR